MSNKNELSKLELVSVMVLNGLMSNYRNIRYFMSHKEMTELAIIQAKHLIDQLEAFEKEQA